MNREAEVKVMSIALLVLQAVGEKSRNNFAHDAKVPWRSLDALADAFREGGVDPMAPNLGKEAAQKVRDAIDRGKEDSDA